MATLKFYIKQNLLAVDQLANTLFGGWADETISSRCYRRAVVEVPKGQTAKRKWRWGMAFVNGLFFDKNHCKTAFESELKRNQAPPTTRPKKDTVTQART